MKLVKEIDLEFFDEIMRIIKKNVIVDWVFILHISIKLQRKPDLYFMEDTYGDT